MEVPASNDADETHAVAATEVPYLPTERQCALLVLLLINAREEEFKNKGEGRTVSRARISQNTLRRLCARSQITPEFLLQIQEYLLAAGWALFCIGATHYAVVRLDSVQGWARISSKRINDQVAQVARGAFPWPMYQHLFTRHSTGAAGSDTEVEE